MLRKDFNFSVQSGEKKKNIRCGIVKNEYERFNICLLLNRAKELVLMAILMDIVSSRLSLHNHEAWVS